MSSIPDAPAPAATPALERLLRRDRLVAIVGLVALAALAWGWTIAGAGSGMSAWDMTSLALFPASRPGMPAMAWSAADAALAAAMWWTMMVAMMTPSAAPAILLYARVQRHAQARGDAAAVAPAAVFAAGYLLAWLGFSLAATALQFALERAGLESGMGMGSRSRGFSAGLLFAAGVYQLTPLKDACLAQCRTPAAFLQRWWRPGTAGALALGLRHGAFCLGCCWLLMALLFVGGVMNLAWIAALTALVIAEKLLPPGRRVARASGVVLLAWATATLLV